MGFVSARARLRASNCLLGYFWVLAITSCSQDAARNEFWHKIRQKTQFRARMWLIGGHRITI